MRWTVACIALLPLLTLPRTARADALDDFTINGGGLNITFSLPAATTLPDADLGGQFKAGPVPGTVNGVDYDISANFIYAVGCAVCSTIELGYDYQTLFIDLPALWQITFPTTETETFSFIPGTYTAGTQYPPGGPSYTIDIAPEAAATTPEPPSLLLLATALVALFFLRQRNLESLPH